MLLSLSNYNVHDIFVGGLDKINPVPHIKKFLKKKCVDIGFSDRKCTIN